MDPLLFSLEVDVVGEVLLTITMISIFVERALSVPFGSRIFIDAADGKGYKEPIAFAFSYFVVWTYDFDAMAIMLKQDSSDWIGLLISAGIVAGGSKGSLKLFQDFLNWRSRAQQIRNPRPGDPPMTNHNPTVTPNASSGSNQGS